jgi:HK97 family phage portal protein
MNFNPRTWLNNRFARSEDKEGNKFVEAFYSMMGGSFTAYDSNRQTYIDKGYNYNPTVYSVISQQSRKASSIPYSVKKIEDKQGLSNLKMFNRATGNDMTIQQKVKHIMLQSKAYEEKGDMPFPMDRPNPNQTWVEFIELYETFMNTTGNFYMYMFSPSEGLNKGEPQHVYVLPSQHTEIVLNSDVVDLKTTNDPISHYIVTVGGSYIEFEKENVIHVKFPNPNFSQTGEHLYGQSPLMAALRNMQSSNTAIDLNNKTLGSGGAYGFIHAKGTTLSQSQAEELKGRLMEMDRSPDRLSNLAGSSAELGFTRISLTTDELKPFDFLSYDEKQICNVLGWSDKLLNNDNGSKYDNINADRKRVVTDKIMPDLKLLANALNDEFLPRFKAYKNTELVFDASELPEMQEDMAKLVSWLSEVLDRGVINRSEYRVAINYIGVDDAEMQEFTVTTDTRKLSDALDDDFGIENNNG